MYEQINHYVEITVLLVYAVMLVNLARMTRKLNRQIRALRPAAPTPADEAIGTSAAALAKARAETVDLRAVAARFDVLIEDLRRLNAEKDINHNHEGQL
jgi:hypothetical protein